MRNNHLMFFSSWLPTGDSSARISTSNLDKDCSLNHWEWDIKRDLIEVTDDQNNLFPTGKGQFFGNSQAFIERLHPQDRVTFYQELLKAEQGGQPNSCIFRLKVNNNELIHQRLDTELVLDEDGVPQRLVGIMRHASELDARDSRLNQQEECIHQWALHPCISEGDWQQGLRYLCSSIAELTQFDYVSVWWFNKGYEALECQEQYRSLPGTYDSETCTDLPKIHQADARDYFHQLLENHCLLCEHITERPSLEPIYDQFLAPKGVESKLDKLILYRGKAAGVLSFECQAGRNWSIEDKNLATAAIAAISQLRLIEEQKQTRRQLSTQHHQYQTFFNRAAEGICRINFLPPIDTTLPAELQREQIISNARFEDINPAGAKLLNQPLQQLQSTPLQVLWNQDDLDHAVLEWILLGYEQSGLETQRGEQHAESHWLSASISGFVDNKMLTHLWVSLKDISEEKKHLKTIAYQAEHDSLTHLPNRFWMMDRIKEQISEKQQLGGTLAVMLLDLDHFKEINDCLGHETGDLLLRQISPRLSRLMQDEHGMLVRLGGDEFAMLFTDVSRDYAERLAQRVNECLKLPFHLHGFKLELTASIGVALFPQHSDEASGLLRCADVAMYQAKRHTKPFAIYNPELDEHSPDRLALMNELGRAVREHELRLHFQPKLNLHDQCINGFEALVRWQHPERGLIYPNKFIHLAEMGDLIRPLTLWVVEQSLIEWQHWQQQGMEFQIAVNLSTRALLDPGCPQAIISLLERYQVAPQWLELEITESALITNPEGSLNSLNILSQAGVRLSLDDFGTGYSSLSYLKELPLDTLKIDMSFVRNMSQDHRDEMIVSSTINLAHNLGLSVVAEGVEDAQTLQLLEQLDCDMVQGYFISKPQPAEQVITRYSGQLPPSAEWQSAGLEEPKLG